MKIRIANESSGLEVVFKLVHNSDTIILKANKGDGFVTIASFDGRSGQVFIYSGRMKRIGFRVYDGGSGRLL